MAETSFGELGKQGHSRREFVKIAAAMPVALAGGAAVIHEVAHEKQLAREGRFTTADADWHPFYEAHTQHEQVVAPERLPAHLDALSFEGIFDRQFVDEQGTANRENYLQIPVDYFMKYEAIGMDTKTPSKVRLIPPETANCLRKRHIPIAFGDIKYWDDMENITVAQADKTRANLGIALTTGGVEGIIAGQGLKSHKIDRKGFLRFIGTVATVAGAGVLLPPVLRTELHEKLVESINTNDVNQRLLARINSIRVDLMPEHLNDLFREIMQANKLITLAEHLKESIDGRLPIIGYNWHIGHRGIEDWLRAGHTATRSCLLAFPDSVLQKMIKVNNNDPRCLTGIRLLDIPNESGKTVEMVSNNSQMPEQTKQQRDIVVEDHVLADALRKRGLQ